MARAIVDWRALYPISGTRSVLIPPPGWRPPRDWASYPRPLDELQDNEILGMAPTESIQRILDMQHGQRGRLVYACSKRWWSFGVCIKDGES
jgi:hypothetical protein